MAAKFADSRVHPRVSMKLTAQICMFGAALEDQPGAAEIVAISQGGITVQGDQALVRALRLDKPETLRSSEYRVSFTLDGADLSCHCRLVHVRRLSQHQYEWGMRFVFDSMADQLQLAALVDAYL